MAGERCEGSRRISATHGLEQLTGRAFRRTGAAPHHAHGLDDGQVTDGHLPQAPGAEVVDEATARQQRHAEAVDRCQPDRRIAAHLDGREDVHMRVVHRDVELDVE